MAKIPATVLLSLLALVATGTTTSRCAQGFVTRLSTSSATSSKSSSKSSSSSSQQQQQQQQPLFFGPAFVSVRGGGGGVLLDSSSSLSSHSVADVDVDVDVDEKTVPSWEILESQLEDIRSSSSHGGEEKKPVLTLYRDTNGWCPFCERVWVAVRAKGLPYQETLVPLQGKPEWYKQMVPTGLVPAVLFHGDDMNTTTSSRELVWESDAILHALDEKFPDTPKLMRHDDAEFDAALELQDRLQAAGFKFSYGNRNGTLTDDELQQNRNDFESVLDELNVALGEQQSKTSTSKGGSFRLGAEFSGVDAIMIPTLERWRYQLPLTEHLDLLENRIHLRNWFDHLEHSFPPYGDRVAGDEYSWTATASTFLRYFGGGEDKPKVAAGIQRADAAAEKLANEFAMRFAANEEEQLSSSSTSSSTSSHYALEAATKLITNHEAVVSDCVREEPMSQKHFPRASASHRDTADMLLRHVASLLLQIASSSSSSNTNTNTNSNTSLAMELAQKDAKPYIVEEEGDAAAQAGALALKTVAKRLCVPRDMGAPSAALLRGILNTVADNLLLQEGAEEVKVEEEAVESSINQ